MNQASTGTSSLQKLYLSHPTPEFRQALDLATKPLNEPGVAGQAIVSSEFYAVELLRRCWQPLTLVGSDHFEIAPWLDEARA